MLARRQLHHCPSDHQTNSKFCIQTSDSFAAESIAAVCSGPLPPVVETEQTNSGSSGKISLRSLERSPDTGTYNSTSAYLPDGSSDPYTGSTSPTGGSTPPTGGSTPPTHTTSSGPHPSTPSSPDGGSSEPELKSSTTHGKSLCSADLLGMAWHGMAWYGMYGMALQPDLLPCVGPLRQSQDFACHSSSKKPCD